MILDIYLFIYFMTDRLELCSIMTESFVALFTSNICKQKQRNKKSGVLQIKVGVLELKILQKIKRLKGLPPFWKPLEPRLLAYEYVRTPRSLALKSLALDQAL